MEGIDWERLIQFLKRISPMGPSFSDPSMNKGDRQDQPMNMNAEPLIMDEQGMENFGGGTGAMEPQLMKYTRLMETMPNPQQPNAAAKGDYGAPPPPGPGLKTPMGMQGNQLPLEEIIKLLMQMKGGGMGGAGMGGPPGPGGGGF